MRYLNTILTILAVLLALQLWTTWSNMDQQSPLFVSEAYAQEGIPNAASQRKQMIDLLKEQNAKLERLIKLMESGKMRVRVEAGQ